MKVTSPTLVAAVLAAAQVTLAAVAQVSTAAPTATPPSVSAPTGGQTSAKRVRPNPTNLQVLPKQLTGDQVHEIMEQWEAALGGSCATCHTADPKNIGPNGKPKLNFADDTKEEKAFARKMYQMTEEINQNYVAKIPNSGAPVTCGTCHRGHLGPEPFVAAEEDGAPKAKNAASASVVPTVK